jgi:hypothetical protein
MKYNTETSKILLARLFKVRVFRLFSIIWQRRYGSYISTLLYEIGLHKSTEPPDFQERTKTTTYGTAALPIFSGGIASRAL